MDIVVSYFLFFFYQSRGCGCNYSQPVARCHLGWADSQQITFFNVREENVVNINVEAGNQSRAAEKTQKRDLDRSDSQLKGKKNNSRPFVSNVDNINVDARARILRIGKEEKREGREKETTDKTEENCAATRPSSNEPHRNIDDELC